MWCIPVIQNWGSHLLKFDSYCFTGFWDTAGDGRTHTDTHSQTDSPTHKDFENKNVNWSSHFAPLYNTSLKSTHAHTCWLALVHNMMACTQTQIHAHTHAWKDAHIHAEHTQRHTHTHTVTYTHTHTHTGACTHTHIIIHTYKEADFRILCSNDRYDTRQQIHSLSVDQSAYHYHRDCTKQQ